MPDLATGGSATNSSAAAQCALVVSVRPINPSRPKERKVMPVPLEMAPEQLGQLLNGMLGDSHVGDLLKVKGMSPSGCPDDVVRSPFDGLTFRVLPTSGLGRLEA